MEFCFEDVLVEFGMICVPSVGLCEGRCRYYIDRNCLWLVEPWSHGKDGVVVFD